MNKKLNIKRLIVAILLFVFIAVLLMVGFFFFMLRPVNKVKKDVLYEVKLGTSAYSVFEDLESNGLIRNSKVLKIYSKLVGGIELDAGTYTINDKMSSIKIFEVLSSDNYISGEQVSLTFKEGIGIKKLISIITQNTNITKEEIENKLKDTEYLDSLIATYWFLTDDIKNKDLYYSLEGYLFPNTYFVAKEGKIEDIFKIMLDETNRVLNKYKKQIDSSEYTIHELITLASVVELETAKKEDRQKAASVFLNRLKINMDLGSCVTTYYAVGKVMGEDELWQVDIDTINPYNTRAGHIILPVGPISNPGDASLDSILNPI